MITQLKIDFTIELLIKLISYMTVIRYVVIKPVISKTGNLFFPSDDSRDNYGFIQMTLSSPTELTFAFTI